MYCCRSISGGNTTGRKCVTPVTKTMKTNIYIVLATAILLSAGIIGGQVWSGHKIKKLEAAVEAAKNAATETGRTAAEKENDANIYKAKIEHLEQQIAEINDTARRQDEKLKTQNTNTVRARRDVDRSRGVRSIDTNADELCANLAGLGHPC